MLVQWLEQKSLKIKTFLPPLICIVAMLFVVASTFWYTYQQRVRLIHIETDSQQKSKIIDEIALTQFSVQQELLITLLRNISIEKAQLEAFKVSQTKIANIEKNYRLTKKELELISEIKEKLNEYKQVVMMVTYAKKEDRLALKLNLDFDKKFNDFIKTLKLYKTYVAVSGKKELKDMLLKSDAYRNYFILLLIAVVLILTLIMVALNKTIIQPVTKLINAVDDDNIKFIVGESTKRKDEIGKIYRIIAKFKNEALDAGKPSGNHLNNASYSENTVKENSNIVSLNLENGFDKKEIKSENTMSAYHNEQINEQPIQVQEDRKETDQKGDKKVHQEEISIVKEKSQLLEMLIIGLTREINLYIGESMSASSAVARNIYKLKKQVRVVEEENYDLIYNFINKSEKNIELVMDKLDLADYMIKNIKRSIVTNEKRDPVWFGINEVIKEAINSFEEKSEDIIFEIAIDKDVMINSYPSELLNVLSILYDNCVIHAFGDSLEGKKITISAISNEKKLTLQFSDNGKGISKQYLEKIFDPFFTTKRGSKGRLGLDLYLAYGIVSQILYGEISVKSELRKGTTFTIILPSDRKN
ncbi:sensor histidine kinase [Spartinivicinus poritis]|uniref:histidine kinase n=1 Tax=Spartinivicinus poritis TaxID=2994640 RepID=A0ABT5U5K5_9GAMM|nr:ATP-binding protein [Spartinivicinus sp. A2-2]MDE1461646.1 ATP-binding protein [Spartinivicinus sp. A2-2]